MADEVFKVDTRNYKESQSDRVSPGTYRVKVDSATVSASKGAATNGSPQMMVWLEIQGGDFAGATIVDRLIAHDKTMFRVVQFLKACGLKVPKAQFAIRTGSVVGKVLDVTVDDSEPYNGQIKSEVRGYMKPATRASAAEVPDDLSGLGEFAPESTSNPAEEEYPDLGDVVDAEEVQVLDGSPSAQRKQEAAERGTSDEVLDLDEVDLDEIEV